MSHSELPVGRRSQGSWTNIVAFVLGVPLGVGLLASIRYGPFHDPLLQRYVSHPVEVATVLLFACACCALVCKLLRQIRERWAFRQDAIPEWDGQTLPVSEAGNLLKGLSDLPRSWFGTVLGRRTVAVLEFVDSRRSANDLDDHLRGLADNDEAALDGSYSLIRFITWAMPILGFLGTVLGITEAIAGVTPEVLEKSLSAVTDGLALAFDTTAVALALTMIVMFLSFVTERLEQGLLEAINRYADEQLAHRFERNGPESDAFVEALRQNVDILLKATEQLVQRQAGVWNQTIEAAQQKWEQTGLAQQQAVTAALEQALQRTLENHDRMLEMQEQRGREANAALLKSIRELTIAVGDSTREQLKALADASHEQQKALADRAHEQQKALAESTREQQKTLAELVASITAQTEVMTQLAASGSQLLHLQEVLQQNLQMVSMAGQFEQAVNSLTAAIHLLTARSTVAPAAVNRMTRPGAAA